MNNWLFPWPQIFAISFLLNSAGNNAGDGVGQGPANSAVVRLAPALVYIHPAFWEHQDPYCDDNCGCEDVFRYDSDREIRHYASDCELWYFSLENSRHPMVTFELQWTPFTHNPHISLPPINLFNICFWFRYSFVLEQTSLYATVDLPIYLCKSRTFPFPHSCVFL